MLLCTFLAVGRSSNAQSLPMHAYSGRLGLKEVWLYSYLVFFGNGGFI
jgi:hypothetical protein